MNTLSPTGKRSNAVAVDVLREFLTLHGCQFDSNPRGPARLLVKKSVDSVAACLVRAGNIQRREKWSLSTHTYLRRGAVEALTDWARVQPRPTESVILFVLRGNGRPAPGRFKIAGRDYHLFAVSAADFAARMWPRGTAWGDKMQVSSRDFEQLAMTLEDWLSRDDARTTDVHFAVTEPRAESAAACSVPPTD